MQSYALEGFSPISAAYAVKGKNYLCPECRAPVRIRSGPRRQIHFYHLARVGHCRQHQKSQEHLQLQLKLLDLIGMENGQIECAFPSIQRIADVAWHEKKIIVEIQCSPITLGEVQSRNRDYQSVGYEVIWILHQKRFNKNNLSAAESFLRTIPCYFTNIDKEGNGVIYDQFEILKDSRRLFKGPCLNVSLTQIARLPDVAPPDLKFPQSILARLSNWKFYANGDLLHRLLQEGNLSQSAIKMLNLEMRLLKEEKPKERLPLSTLLAKSYQTLLDHILKKLCKHGP